MKKFRNSSLAMTASVVTAVLLVTGLVQAATTISTNIATDGTLSVTGLATFLGGATTTSITLLNGETITNTGDGIVVTSGIASSTNLRGDTAIFGLASSTALLVGQEANSTVSGIMFGSCAVAATTLSSASTTYTTCIGATGVTSSYKVFVQATSSIPFGVVVDAASTTSTTGTISIRLYNTRAPTQAIPSDLTAGQVYLNYWAIR